MIVLDEVNAFQAEHFSTLSDDSFVKIPVLKIVLGRSARSIESDVVAGRLPQPRRFGPGKRGWRAWRVGDIRKALIVGQV